MKLHFARAMALAAFSLATVTLLAMGLDLSSVGAFAQQAGSAVPPAPPSPLIEALQPYIDAGTNAAVTVLVGLLAALAKRYVGITLDARARETLHSALDTGAHAAVSAITAKAGRLQDEVRDARIAFILEWAEQGAAGAIRHFGVDRSQLETLATAKLQRALGQTAAGV